MKATKIQRGLILCLCILINLGISAQTRIGLKVSTEFAKIQENRGSGLALYIPDGDTYRYRALPIGLNIEQQLSKRFFLNLDMDYSRKRFRAEDTAFFPWTHLTYKDYFAQLGLGLKLKEHFAIKLGLGAHYLPLIHKVHEDYPDLDVMLVYQEKLAEYGAHFSVSYRSNGIQFSVDYYHGLVNKSYESMNDFSILAKKMP